jgi:hypothetical protein
VWVIERVMNSIKGELVNFEYKKTIFCKEVKKTSLSLGFGVDVEIEKIKDKDEK